MTEKRKNNIRNFAILAHIDHGKSTLADRMLEMTKTIEGRKMKEQLLDTMDLERERGITIKLQPVTMRYEYAGKNSKVKSQSHNSKPDSYEIQNSKEESGQNTSEKSIQDSRFPPQSGVPLSKENKKVAGKIQDSTYTLNLIDTPGHVDFGYEVSRSLKAVEGAILLVDCTQGIQAQTLANLYQALEQDLEIIPVVNKIDLPNAEIEKTKTEIKHLLGCGEEEIILASGKSGEGVEEIMNAVVERIPAPEIVEDAPLRALIFDSKYDSYKGVLAFVRIFDGAIKREDKIYLMRGEKEAHAVEVGKFSPDLKPTGTLETGEIGYIATGLKSVEQCRVGDTLTISNFQFPISNESSKTELKSKKTTVVPLEGYREVRPMMYASFYPAEGEDYNQFRDALEKLKLNDAALDFEGESSPALGRGFRIGFLGVLHLEIVKERLSREFGFAPVITTPSVVYEVERTNGETMKIYSAAEMPDKTEIKEIREPRAKLEIITPSRFIGDIMEVTQSTTRSEYISTDYLDEDRVNLIFNAPLADIVINLHDNIKSATSGFASFSYELTDYRPADLARLDIYVAEEKVDSFSQVVHEKNAQAEGRRIVKKLKDVIPRQNFQIKLQAAVGSKFLARENIQAFRKDVTAKLYGGDVTRKRKLLEKQKKGKKKMTQSGKVDIPQKAFLEVLKR
ncbi:MAG: translation elongation factor 4 [Candidatus Moranbacteria bacterium]|nr:translation elongation factor 4 [Candidatus Moranbacteria bacterium]